MESWYHGKRSDKEEINIVAEEEISVDWCDQCKLIRIKTINPTHIMEYIIDCPEHDTPSGHCNLSNTD